MTNQVDRFYLKMSIEDLLVHHAFSEVLRMLLSIGVKRQLKMTGWRRQGWDESLTLLQIATNGIERLEPHSASVGGYEIRD